MDDPVPEPSGLDAAGLRASASLPDMIALLAHGPGDYDMVARALLPGAVLVELSQLARVTWQLESKWQRTSMVIDVVDGLPTGDDRLDQVIGVLRDARPNEPREFGYWFRVLATLNAQVGRNSLANHYQLTRLWNEGLKARRMLVPSGKTRKSLFRRREIVMYCAADSDAVDRLREDLRSRILSESNQAAKHVPGPNKPRARLAFILTQPGMMKAAVELRIEAGRRESDEIVPLLPLFKVIDAMVDRVRRAREMGFEAAE